MSTRIAEWLGLQRPGTSLQAILTYPFIVLILVTVILTGFFSFYYSGKAIDDMVGQLMEKITDQISNNIINFLDRAHLVNEINTNAIEEGQIDLKRMSSMEVHFWNQLRSVEYISYSYLGSAEGGFFGARRLADGTLQTIATKTLTGGEILYFDTDDHGHRTKVSSTLPSYDHKTRPWYKAALQAGKPTWSPVFVDAGGEGLTITAAKPIYDVAGKPKGVLGSSFIFSHINQFLRSLKIGETGQTFVMERSGLLVATSTSDPTATADKKRITARESENPLIRHASGLISERFGDLSGIDRQQHLSTDIKGERYLVHLTPFKDGRGIDWIIAVMVPQNDFMSSIKKIHSNTIMLSFISLILTIMAGFIIARRITQPILKLNRASKALAAGEWSQVIEIHRRDEIGELAESFNMMARQLRDAIENLEQKVTERTAAIMEISRKHAVSEKKYRALHENLRDGSAIIDTEGRITEFNKAFQILIGYSAEEIPSLKFTDITPANWHTMENEIMAEQVLKRGYSDLYEKEFIRKDGKIIAVEISTYLVRDENNNSAGFWAFIRDITDRKRAEEALIESENKYRELSIVDGLTQLYNSRHFYNQLKMEIDRADRYKQPLTILLLDLDNFKSFNDAYGHVEGDQVLSRLGQVIKRCLRQTDSAYRYGGEEFTILLPMSTSTKSNVTAERIRAEFKKENFSPAPGKEVHMTVSIGIAQYRQDENMKAFVNRVDQLMYQAKKNGKDRVCSDSHPQEQGK